MFNKWKKGFDVIITTEKRFTVTREHNGEARAISTNAFVSSYKRKKDACEFKRTIENMIKFGAISGITDIKIEPVWY